LPATEWIRHHHKVSQAKLHQKTSQLSLLTPGSTQSSLNIATELSEKTLEDGTQNLAAEWQQFTQNGQRGHSLVILSLKFVYFYPHIQTDIEKYQLGSFSEVGCRYNNRCKVYNIILPHKHSLTISH
jgi:hypothetical protein